MDARLHGGDHIYVYNSNSAPAAGQWVQVFQKPASEGLVDDIKRMIMPDYPTPDCPVRRTRTPAAAGQGRNFEYAGIVVRLVPDDSTEDMLPRWRTCPHPYTVVGGIGYFRVDTLHPDRLVFLNIGQYYILAGGDLPWQATMRVE